jgi:DNA polymerase-3 subunit alpha
MRHNQEDENRVNTTLILARKHRSENVATNNTFIEKRPTRYFIVCRDGEKQTTPIGRGRGYRFGLPNQNTISRQEEMKQLFTVCLKRFRTCLKL